MTAAPAQTTELRALEISDLARLFGACVDDVESACGPLPSDAQLLYVEPLAARQRQLMLEAQTLEDGAPSRAGRDRLHDWERGWDENLRAFRASHYRLETLVPRYFERAGPVRLEGRYVEPLDGEFYLHYTRAFTRWLFRRWLADVPSVYEFGCGPGAHLVRLAEQFPDKCLWGLDWARSSQCILKLLAEQRGLPVRGRHFDLFRPDSGLELAEGCGVFTFGALEQLGSEFGPFLEYLLQQPVAVVLHVEGIEELYDADDAFDRAALRYHRRRNYLSGLLPALRTLAAQGRIEIVDVHRHRAGVFTNDTYSRIVWRPVRSNAATSRASSPESPCA